MSSIYFGRRNSSGSSTQVEVIELENSLDLLNCNEFLNSNLELDDETSNGEKVGNNDNGSTFSWSMIVAAFPNSTWLVLFRLIALNPLKLTLTLVCHVLVESFDHCANRNQVVLHGAFVPDNYFLLTFAPICQWSLTWIIMLHLKAHF